MTRRWTSVARAAGLLRADGTPGATIFAEMSALAASTGAINLGQGFPDVDGPASVAAAAQRAIADGANQYPPGPGILELREAIAEHQAARYGLVVDPGTQVLVTAGATEAIAASVLALAGPDDEVLTLEPFYDAYAAVVAMAGATHTTAPLRATPDGFRVDLAALEQAFTDRTRIVLLNTPHNPTGAVLTHDELVAVARLAQRHDALVVTDEVYEHLTLDGPHGRPPHVPIASLPGMAKRTLTISSAGKTFSFTGWKIGWVAGPEHLVAAVRTVKQFLTYVSGAPFQPAVAFALRDPGVAQWVDDLAASLARRRDLLCEGLVAAGLDVVRPDGTYFVLADARPLGHEDGAELCRALPALAGVVGVPVRAFTTAGSSADEALASWVRFTFVKREDVLERAVEGLARLGR
ncbi:aminotransferase class I/II-fold pyridoxal phosphate-dependent enzyme [Cellulomonas sp. HZM]|uniref:aminotransferase class I/II-fold pyridoxal phosphate-dependent enzyme n=1 Tax=Cellulomonas sp. HZM TaxID=1454010 RepID=UPI0004930475|nr:aminotransferase class I/II-fold pyridoxal phosphate-dependent enzyme [Cellulomonas sp. HZM]